MPKKDSYFPFDEIIKENEIVTIKELSERFEKKDTSTMPILWEDDVKLFPAMGRSTRFGEMKVTKYVNKISVEQEKQFSAITIIMPDDTLYVSYHIPWGGASIWNTIQSVNRPLPCWRR